MKLPGMYAWTYMCEACNKLFTNYNDNNTTAHMPPTGWTLSSCKRFMVCSEYKCKEHIKMYELLR